jgi:hypothetical protein
MWGYEVLGPLGKDWIGEPSTVIVSHNIISPKGSSGQDGIDIMNPGAAEGQPTTAYALTNNKIIINDNPGQEWTWGIMMDASNSVISNNKFSGYGGYGVVLVNWWGGLADSGNAIMKNDFTGLELVSWGQDIYLGSLVYNTTVFKNGKDATWWDDSGLCGNTNDWCASDSDCGGGTCVLTNTIVASKKGASDKAALKDAIKKAKMCQRGMKSGRLLGEQLELCGIQM